MRRGSLEFLERLVFFWRELVDGLRHLPRQSCRWIRRLVCLGLPPARAVRLAERLRRDLFVVLERKRGLGRIFAHGGVLDGPGPELLGRLGVLAAQERAVLPITHRATKYAPSCDSSM